MPEGVVLSFNANAPTAVLLAPTVLFKSAWLPKAELPPLVLNLRELLPTAVFCSPTRLEVSERFPTAVFVLPEVFKIRAW